MISIRSSADLARALDGPLEPALRSLLELRRDQLIDGGDADIGDVAHIIVVARADGLAAVEAEAGFPLAGDEAPIEWAERHPGGIVEAAIVTDDDGFAVVIFARDCVLAETHQRSYATTEMYMRRHIVTRWGRVRITDIDSRAVGQWLAAKRDEGLAPATVLKIKMIFSRSFELGARWGVAGCDRPNPVRAVPSKPVDNARQVYVTADEAARLVEAARASRNPQLAAIIQLLLLTGMRVSELLSARWANVDLDRRSLFVPTSKTGRSRHIPLAQSALDVIAGIPRPEVATFLFSSPADPRKPLGSIKTGWRTARDAAGLPGLRIHDLRHSAASFMVNSGVDLFAVGRVLGHANVASTSRYAHLNDATLLAAVEAGAAKQASAA